MLFRTSTDLDSNFLAKLLVKHSSGFPCWRARQLHSSHRPPMKLSKGFWPSPGRSSTMW